MVRHRRKHGFALVDIIVAAIMLGVSVAVVSDLVGRAISSQTVGEKMATAAMLADEQLQLVLARGPDDYARRFSSTGKCDAPFTDFSYRLDITGGQSVGETYSVKCTILWKSGATERSVTVSTLMAPRSGGEGEGPDPDRTPQQPVTRLE